LGGVRETATGNEKGGEKKLPSEPFIQKKAKRKSKQEECAYVKGGRAVGMARGRKSLILHRKTEDIQSG